MEIERKWLAGTLRGEVAEQLSAAVAWWTQRSCASSSAQIMVDDQARVIVRSPDVMFDTGGTSKGLCGDTVDMISLSLLIGLAMATRLLRRPALKRVLVRLHKHMALITLVAIALHGLAARRSWLQPERATLWGS